VKNLGGDDEPIRILNREEFETLRASIIAERNQQNQQPQEPTPKVAGQRQPEAATPSAEALKLGSEIWEMRKRGWSRYEISNRLSIPINDVEHILCEFQAQLYPDAGAAIAQRLSLDHARLDNLFQTWLPIATAGPVEVKKFDRKGREYTELDSDTAIRAAGVVLGAIKGRVQLALAMAGRPESAGGKDGSASTNIAIWLSQVMPQIQTVVNQVKGNASAEQLDGRPSQRPRQTLVLECAAESEDMSNGAPTNGGQSSRGSIR
jgi:hypothetical protein